MRPIEFWTKEKDTLLVIRDRLIERSENPSDPDRSIAASLVGEAQELYRSVIEALEDEREDDLGMLQARYALYLKRINTVSRH